MFSIRKAYYLVIFGLLLSPVMVSITCLQQFSYSQQNTHKFIINNMSDNDGDSVYPLVASSGNNVYVTWQDNVFGHNKHLNYDILFKSSSDGGHTFGDVMKPQQAIWFSARPAPTDIPTVRRKAWAEVARPASCQPPPGAPSETQNWSLLPPTCPLRNSRRRPRVTGPRRRLRPMRRRWRGYPRSLPPGAPHARSPDR